MKNITDKTKKWLTIAGLGIVCVALVIAISSKFKRQTPVDDVIDPPTAVTDQGVRIAVTATEAALYDEQLGGGLRSKMASLSHQNLPLAIFLETPVLGYPAWSGSTTSKASNADIKSSLGLGIVRYCYPVAGMKNRTRYSRV